MGNECSDDLKAALSKAELKFQLVLPHIHRVNKAERSIQTFKGHLKAGLVILNPNFPIHEWCRILTQCELTLNLLRVSRINPKLLTWAYLFGEFVYENSSCPIRYKMIGVFKNESEGYVGTKRRRRLDIWLFTGIL